MSLVFERLQTATQPDLDSINGLLGQLKSDFEPETLEGLHQTVTDTHTFAFVVREDGVIVGMAFLFLFQTLQKRCGYVEDVVVDARMQGKGVGTKLMQTLLDAAKELGMTDVELTSRPTREAANKLYLKLGFTKRETNVYHYKVA
jgi:ribosomal protein S18 acetylase RimI-like enzyme